MNFTLFEDCLQQRHIDVTKTSLELLLSCLVLITKGLRFTNQSSASRQEDVTMQNAITTLPKLYRIDMNKQFFDSFKDVFQTSAKPVKDIVATSP